jgi:hypothetical protein
LKGGSICNRDEGDKGDKTKTDCFCFIPCIPSSLLKGVFGGNIFTGIKGINGINYQKSAFVVIP